jgi:hypothetical protein
MNPKRTRYEYVDGVKMQISTFDVYELVDGRRVYTTIETRNAVDLWGLD